VRLLPPRIFFLSLLVGPARARGISIGQAELEEEEIKLKEGH
jgi:hypothetical protein